ncbi:MAG: methyltransferase domain-containing protein [Candidatus Eisenbacteria bacterium]|jgi:SAM-dependent methyltransferase|nr:methyltransferase domain-containing protein [Candidatus Eisenbacteria bacterium]
MTPELAGRLAAINRAFYENHALEFSDTRSASGAEIKWIIPWIPAGASVLDLGCGNGRTAALLATRGFRGVYVGIDGSPSLVRLARESAALIGLETATFLKGDLLDDEMPALLAREGIPRLFDVITLLAVLHHLPGGEARGRAVRRAAAALAPDGRMLLSTWQFQDHERMRRKIVAWSVAGIDENEVDPGDALLGWGGSEGYRYCHLIGKDELAELARDAGLEVVFTTRTGGREGTLSLCAVLHRMTGNEAPDRL